MDKLVNVNSGKPIRVDGILFSGNITHMKLSTDTIRKCLLSGIRVEEVYNGKCVPLDFTNFDKENPLVAQEVPAKKPAYTIVKYDKYGKPIRPDIKPMQVKAVPNTPAPVQQKHQQQSKKK